MAKAVPELIYLIQNQSDPVLREDAVFVIGEWAWMYDIEIMTRNPRDGTPTVQELSFFVVPLFSHLAASDAFVEVRMVAAQALGNFAAVTASRYSYLVAAEQSQNHSTGVNMFSMSLRVQLQSIAAAFSKCLLSETKPGVQREILLSLLKFAHYLHMLDYESMNLFEVVAQLARFAPDATIQALALGLLQRMQTYPALQLLTNILMPRRWSALGQ